MGGRDELAPLARHERKAWVGAAAPSLQDERGFLEIHGVDGAVRATGTVLGELVMRELKRIDKVACVRFASVYRSFEDVDEFRQLIRDI